MKQVSFILRRIWCCWFFLSGLISFLILYPFFLLFLSREKWFRYAWRLKTVWAHWILLSVGIRYKLEFEEKIDRKRAFVICSNHASYLDIILTNIAFPNYFHFMGKAELLNVPLFKIFFKRMNISVNRSSIRDSHKAFERARSDMQKGISIAIFPEATIPECAPRLAPFKNGVFKLAIDEQAPIVPITFLDSWYLFPDSSRERFVVRPGLSRVIIHKPISTIGLTDADVGSLKSRIHELIGNTIEEKGNISRGANC